MQQNCHGSCTRAVLKAIWLSIFVPVFLPCVISFVSLHWFPVVAVWKCMYINNSAHQKDLSFYMHYGQACIVFQNSSLSSSLLCQKFFLVSCSYWDRDITLLLFLMIFCRHSTQGIKIGNVALVRAVTIRLSVPPIFLSNFDPIFLSTSLSSFCPSHRIALPAGHLICCSRSRPKTLQTSIFLNRK